MAIDFSPKMKQFVRPPVTPEQQDQKLKDVAGMYEKQFLREMVKAMRSTVNESEFMPASQAEKIFKEQLDEQYVDKWGQKGGIGLSDLIYQQLIEKYGAQMGIKPAQFPQRGMQTLPDAYKKDPQHFPAPQMEANLKNNQAAAAMKALASSDESAE